MPREISIPFLPQTGQASPAAIFAVAGPRAVPLHIQPGEVVLLPVAAAAEVVFPFERPVKEDGHPLRQAHRADVARVQAALRGDSRRADAAAEEGGELGLVDLPVAAQEDNHDPPALPLIDDRLAALFLGHV